MKRRNSQQGVALVVTLILLSVITFMAVTFLVISRRERERVTTQSSQSDAKFAGEAGLEQAKGLIIASMLARTNGYDFSLLVSTNYINPAGFVSTNGQIITNVSYTYGQAQGGGPVIGKDVWRLMNNLQLLPRVPVYVTTNKALPPDFRYYLDLNRNGAFDTNGFGTNYFAGLPIFDSVTGRPLTNTFVGDPEWVGLLDKPEQPHSSSNLFVARYAFVAQPIGNSLDINFIHNQAKRNAAKQDGFLRDQGFGSWELNLAAFLYTLNTNQWGGTYSYSTNLTGPSTGRAFTNALGILRYRYNLGFVNLRSISSLYGPAAAIVFGRSDQIDGYLHGPVMTGIHASTPDPDANFTTQPWSGADNPQHFFSSQDLFSTDSNNPQLADFSAGLYSAGTNLLNSYDRYTYSRMLSQIGNDSAPESPDKLNLNYVNVNGTNATNFIAWTPVQFFTNAADKLLKDLATNDPAPRYPYPTDFGIAHIPISPTNYYTPAVHRMLQLAANMYDAGNSNIFPSVFRPVFTNGVGTNISIVGYTPVDETTNTFDYVSRPLALPEEASKVDSKTTNIYGVPWVIGAKKGFPNFNELAMSSVGQITRRLQVDKHKAGSERSTWTISEMYQVGVSNVFGVEAWNSYTNAYLLNQVEIRVEDDLRMSLIVTNAGNPNPVYTTNLPANFIVGTNFPILAAGAWRGTLQAASPSPLSFQNYRSNVFFVPDYIYRQNPPGLVTSDSYQPISLTPPHFVLGTTNWFRFIMRDPVSRRIIDYVQFSNPAPVRDLTEEARANDPYGVWGTNIVTYNSIKMPSGIKGQLQIAQGIAPDDAWTRAQLGAGQGNSKLQAAGPFQDFFINPANTTTFSPVPFSPTAKFHVASSWQANDPLVHYTLDDMGTSLVPVIPQLVDFTDVGSFTKKIIQNIGLVNARYHPWKYDRNQASDEGFTDPAFKDPLVSSSDAWDFSTNKYPSIGWLGRVHRGTPWQTIYLKSSTVVPASWQKWSGNPDITNSVLTQPMKDWKFLDLFTVAQNDNASRGQLSINQTNLAAWAAVVQGVVVLTNATAAAPLTPLTIDPFTNDVAFHTIVNGINSRRASSVTNGTQVINNYPGQVYTRLGDILSVPELTVNSPFLNTNDITSLSDAAYERLPQQILSLLKVGEPRYVIYSYGQSLKPADRSIVQTAGPYFGICTNYQITGEVATRTVVRIENRPVPGKTNAPNPQVILESFNVLPPE
ncbi:MAG: hypothetical protein JWR69_1236 [Pedosphaera sp.]|nr:hypothetical protein [Pedosphaera sp.]